LKCGEKKKGKNQREGERDIERSGGTEKIKEERI
jgi:hypothetical protein